MGASRGGPRREETACPFSSPTSSTPPSPPPRTAATAGSPPTTARLDVVVNPPKELGGSGAGTNPEQLFAAGYSACFQGALAVVARQAGIDVSGSRVTAKVGLGKNEEGFGIIVEISAEIPGVAEGVARELAEKAHGVCPYSKATRGNIGVTLA